MDDKQPVRISIRIIQVHARWGDPLRIMVSGTIPFAKANTLIGNIIQHYSGETGTPLQPVPEKVSIRSIALQIYFTIGWQETKPIEFGFDSLDSGLEALDKIWHIAIRISNLKWKSKFGKEVMDKYRNMEKENGQR